MRMRDKQTVSENFRYSVLSSIQEIACVVLGGRDNHYTTETETKTLNQLLF